MKSFFTVNRIMYASAFFVLCIAIVLNITTQIPFVGFLPVVRWIDVAVNAVAAEYHVSTSVVKKDMAAACRLFGVTNKESLRILLLQYKIK